MLVAFSALLLLLAACGGQTAEEELLEQILENSGEGIGDIEVDLGDDGDEFNLNVTGDDGENVSISGSGDDDEMTITIEGEDGETMTIGGGEIPEGLQIPVPPGGAVQSSIVGGNEILVSLQYLNASYDDIVGFYDDQLDADSDDVEKTETSFTTEDGTFRNVYYGPSSGSDWTVTVGDCIGLPGICVNIIQSQ
jgi:hypothetical protein